MTPSPKAEAKGRKLSNYLCFAPGIQHADADSSRSWSRLAMSAASAVPPTSGR
jgi:hypothetical protein